MEHLRVTDSPTDTLLAWFWGTNVTADMTPREETWEGLSEDWGWDHWVTGAVLEGQALAALMPRWALIFWGFRICLTWPEESEVDEVADPLHGSTQGQLCLPTCPVPGPSSESTPSLWRVCAWGNQPLLAAVLLPREVLSITGSTQSLLTVNEMTVPFKINNVVQINKANWEEVNTAYLIDHKIFASHPRS